MSLIVRTNVRVAWRLPFSRSELRRIVVSMLAAANEPEVDVELTLIEDRRMEELHLEHMGCLGPTNVLSFPARQETPGVFARPGSQEPGALLGCIALAPETLQRECMLYGQPPEKYALRLLAHGLAHILGLEHGPAMESLCRTMENAVEC